MSTIKNHINTYADLTAYNADLNKDYPNISYIQASDEVKWNKYDPDHIVAIYNVTSTSSATKLLNSSSGITYQIIDGVKQQSVQSNYTFNTLGEHTVKYNLSGTSIGSDAFSNCSGLTSVTMPNTVTSIGSGAFSYCSSLRSVTIPNSVTSIGVSAFWGCSGLTSITVDADNTVYDSRNNCNAIIETATNTLIEGCKNTIIPNTVTSIGSGAFYGRTNLTSITLPNGVTSIGSDAFSNCSSLTSITIPNSVTSIGDNTFSSCTALTNVTIGNGVRSIGTYAFGWCTSLTRITVQATTPPELGYLVFTSTNYCPIYVPAARVNTYKTATNWSTYASRIQAIPTT